MPIPIIGAILALFTSISLLFGLGGSSLSSSAPSHHNSQPSVNKVISDTKKPDSKKTAPKKSGSEKPDSDKSGSNETNPDKSDPDKVVPDSKAPQKPEQPDKKPAQPAQPERDLSVTPVYQGQKVYNKRSNGTMNSCTISYVDSTHRRAYIARHCIVDKSLANPVAIEGAPIYVYMDPRNDSTDPYVTNDHSQYKYITPVVIGNAYSVDNGSDIAIINLSNNAITSTNTEDNTFAQGVSDKLTDSSERVCIYSRMANRTECGNIVRVYKKDGVHRMDAETEVQPGDSGGPVWLESTGETIGVIAAKYIDVPVPRTDIALFYGTNALI